MVFKDILLSNSFWCVFYLSILAEKIFQAVMQEYKFRNALRSNQIYADLLKNQYLPTIVCAK